MIDTLRIGVIGSEAETGPLVASADRLAGIDCDFVSDDRELKHRELKHCDAVGYCALPNNDMQSIRDVARSGKHLVIDLAALTDVAETGAIVAACDAAKVQLMIAQPHRYLPSVRAVQESQEVGQLGEPGLLRIHRWVAGRNKNLFPLLLREVDLANYIIGRPPETVYAIARDAEHSPQLVQVHLGFSGGAMALIDIATCLPEGDGYYSLSLIGADGSATIDDHHNMQLLYCGGPALAQRTPEASLHWTESLQQFGSAIAHQSKEAIGVDSALSALRVVEAVRRSISSGIVMHRQGDGYEGE